MFVYFLTTNDLKNTYIGATVNLEQRLRKHNGEIKGGAVATTQKVAKGKTWHIVCYVKNFPTWKACLQFEWRWKQLSRKLFGHYNPIDCRKHALNELLALDKPTTVAMPYSEWLTPPEIVWL